MNPTLRAAYRAEGIRVPRGHPERDLQIQIAGYLDWALPPTHWYTAIDHSFQGQRKGWMLRRMGVKASILDMLILGPNRFVGWLENKSLTGKLTLGQRELISRFRGYGHRVATPRTLEEAITAVSAWGIVLLTEKPATERIRRGLAQPQDWPESELGRKSRK